MINSHLPLENVLILDTETTGLTADDEILQLSIINGKGQTLMNTYIRPYAKTAWPTAQAVNHIAPQDVTSSPTFAEIYPQFQQILSRAELLIGYNLNFDLKMLKAASARTNIPWNYHGQTFDMMYHFRKTHPQGRHRLIDCAAHHGYTFQAHDSLADCRATLHCYQNSLQENPQK